MAKTFIVSIVNDDDVPNPRDDWDFIGTLYTWHPHYTLGGKNDHNNQDHIVDLHAWVYDWLIPSEDKESLFSNFSFDYEVLMFDDHEANVDEQTKFEALVNRWITDNCAILPVYLYDHSGVTISTRPFSCPWDSGQVGFIYVTRETCEETGENFDAAEKILKAEIETLDQYLTGDVWHYCISEFAGSDEELEEILDSLSDVDTLYKDEKIVIYSTSQDYDDSQLEWRDSCGGYYGFKYTKETGKHLCFSFFFEDAKKLE
jgi:hypothetical protein